MKFSVSKIPVDYLNEIAAKFKILRKDAGLSQQEFALKSGVSLGSIKRFETTGQISFESLLKLAHILSRLDDFEKIFYQDETLKKVKKMFSERGNAE